MLKIGLWKGPDTRSTCVVTMNPTQAGQLRAVGTRSAPPGLTEDILSPQKKNRIDGCDGTKISVVLPPWNRRD